MMKLFKNDVRQRIKLDNPNGDGEMENDNCDTNY